VAEQLKLPEVARRLGVSEKTARRYIKSGTLPSTFIGGAYRVDEEDLKQYLEDAKVQPQDGPGEAPTSPSLEWALAAPGKEFDGWVQTATSAELHKLFFSLDKYAEGLEERNRRLGVLGRAQKAIDQFFRLQGIDTEQTAARWPSTTNEEESRQAG
jgi:excisionase family DNA binding protein